MSKSKSLDTLDVLEAKLQFQKFNQLFSIWEYRKISKKLSDSSTSPKCYWTLLKTLSNGRLFPVYHHFFTITNLSLT